MAEFAGQLEVKVSPDTSSFRRDLETGATTAAARAAERIGREMGKIIAQQISKGITDGLATIRTGTAGAAAGRQFGRSFAKTANAEIKAGVKSVSVKVHADTKAARTEIDAFAKAAGERLAEQVADGLRDGATEGSRDIPKQAPKAGAEYGGEFARSLKARLSEALKNLPDVEINADSSDADIKIREIRGQLEALRDKKIGVDISAADALTRLRAIQGQLTDLERNSPDIQVRVDAAAATARLQQFAAQAERLERDGVDVDVDVDTGGAVASLAALRGAAGGTQSGMLGIIAAAVALGPALVPIGAAGTAALAAVGTAAVGAAGGIGVLVLALKPVIEVMQLLGKAESAAGAAAGQAAGQHLQMAAASDALKAAQDGLASAIQNAREQEERSAERVADARRGLARAKEDAARDEAEAARRVADAERDLADAQRDFVEAQLAINDARKEAAEQLEDLQSRLANAYLDNEAAQLRMEEAAARLNEVEQDATSTSIERRQAQLELNRAQQALTDSQRELTRLQKESDEANRKGIDGSDAVTRAKEREKDAADRLGDAHQGVADAQEDAERRRRESDERVADAQRALAQAVQDAAIQQRKSAEQVAAAQRQVESAQRGVERATTSAGASGGAAMNNLRDALAKLSPEGRKFVQFLKGEFLPAFSGLSKVAQKGLLPGLQEAMGSLLRLAPLATEVVGSLSRAMGTLFREAGRALEGPFWQDFFRFIADTAAPALLTFGRTIGNLITGFAGLFQAFAPVGLSVGDAFLRLSERFAEFGRTARENPAFQEFLAYVREVGPLVVATIGSLVRAVGSILAALAPVGPVVLQIVKAVADWIATANPVVIQAIAVGFVAVGAAMALLNANPIVLIGVAIAGLVAGIGWLYDNVEWFREYWDWAWENLSAVVKFAWEEVIKPAFNAMRSFIVDRLVPTILGFYFDTIHPTFVRIYTIIRFAWEEVIKPAFRNLRDFIVDRLVPTILGFYFDTIHPTFVRIYTIIRFAWEEVIKPAFRNLRDFIRDVLAPAVMWFWKNIIEPAWQGISFAIGVAWAVIKLVFGAIRTFIHEVLAPVFRWLWKNVIQPVWTGIQVAIDIAWAIIRLIFGAIRTYIREVLAPVFRWLWDNIIKPVWNGISNTIETVWNRFIKPVLTKVGDFIEDHVAPAFRRGVDAIRAAWDRVREAAAVPVRFIVNTVINRGIIGAYNRLAGWFGVDPVNEVQLPDGFATGGLLRGPGTGTSDSILARVSAGEYVIRADVVKRLGVDFFDAINATGNVAGDIKSVVGAPRFASGGLVQRVLSWLPSTDPLPYVWGAVGPNGYDCSGLTGEAFNRLTGRPSYRRAFTTSSDFTALGFRRGEGMFTLGLTPGEHVVGRLGTLPFEAQSSRTGIFVGSGATPVSRMAQQWFLPSIGPGGGDPPSGFDIKHPIQSMKNLIMAPLAKLSEIEGTPFGSLAAHMPRALADAAVGKLTSAFDGIPGFARGGLVSYDSGGWLPQGLSTVVNASGSPEPVLTPGQWDALAGAGGGPNVDVTVYNPVPETASESTTRIMRRLTYAGAGG